jgi:hypothetical protein
MNKKWLFGLLLIFGIGVVIAGGFVYHNFIIQSDVKEPFSIEYAIIGDAGTWDGVTHCNSEGLNWFTVPDGVTLDKDGLYAGEERLVCARITNLAEADIPFTISNTILNEDEIANTNCVLAFGVNSVAGIALKQAQTIAEFPVVVSASASPINDCLIKIIASRG